MSEPTRAELLAAIRERAAKLKPPLTIESMVDWYAADVLLLLVEIDDLQAKLKIPHPARDIANECDQLLASKNAEIERLEKTIDEYERDMYEFVEPLSPDTSWDMMMMIARQLKQADNECIERLQAREKIWERRSDIDAAMLDERWNADWSLEYWRARDSFCVLDSDGKLVTNLFPTALKACRAALKTVIL